MSSKFKIRAIKDACGWKTGDEFYAEYVNGGLRYQFIDNDGDIRNRRTGHLGLSFNIIPETPAYQSPVKERVVKEIQSGIYGIVNVPPNAGKVSLIPKARDYTAQDLRHAARVFNDLAEVLEGNKDV